MHINLKKKKQLFDFKIDNVMYDKIAQRFYG